MLTKRQVFTKLSLFHLPIIPVWGPLNPCKSNSLKILETFKEVLDPVTSHPLWPLCRPAQSNHRTKKRLKSAPLPSIRPDHPLRTWTQSHRPSKETKIKLEALVLRMSFLHKEPVSNLSVVQVKKHHLCHKVSILRKLATNSTKVDTQQHHSNNEDAIHLKSKPKSLQQHLIVEVGRFTKMSWRTNLVFTKNMIRSRTLLPFCYINNSYKQEISNIKGLLNNPSTIISWVIIITHRLAHQLTLRRLINSTRLLTGTLLRCLVLFLLLESNPNTNPPMERPQPNYSTNLLHN